MSKKIWFLRYEGRNNPKMPKTGTNDTFRLREKKAQWILLIFAKTQDGVIIQHAAKTASPE